MANTFYWHDYETFGIEPVPKIAPRSFAGLRTDEDLNPIGEPLVIYCQPQKDIFAIPTSLLSHRHYPSAGSAERPFRTRVHRCYTSAIVASWYLWRWLQQYPFLMMKLVAIASIEISMILIKESGKNGNSRWDILDMLRLTRAIAP